MNLPVVSLPLRIKRRRKSKSTNPKINRDPLSNLFLAKESWNDGVEFLFKEKIYNPENATIKAFEAYCFNIVKRCFGSDFARIYFPYDPEQLAGIFLSALDSQSAEFKPEVLYNGQEASAVTLGQSFLNVRVSTEDRLAAVLVHECLHHWRRISNPNIDNSKPEEVNCNTQTMEILMHAGYNHWAIHDIFADIAKEGTDYVQIFGAHLEPANMARVLKDQAAQLIARRNSDNPLQPIALEAIELSYQANLRYPPMGSESGWWYLDDFDFEEALAATTDAVDFITNPTNQKNYYLFWRSVAVLNHVKEVIKYEEVENHLWTGNDNLKPFEEVCEQFIRLEDYIEKNQEALTTEEFNPNTFWPGERTSQNLAENFTHLTRRSLGSELYITNKLEQFINSGSSTDYIRIAEDVAAFREAHPNLIYRIEVKTEEFYGIACGNQRSDKELEQGAGLSKVINPNTKYQRVFQLHQELESSNPEKADKIGLVLAMLDVQHFDSNFQLPDDADRGVEISTRTRSRETPIFDRDRNLIDIISYQRPKEITLDEAIAAQGADQQTFYQNCLSCGYFKHSHQQSKAEQALREKTEISLWEKQQEREVKLKTNWKLIEKDFDQFCDKYIEQLSLPTFNPPPSDWQKKFANKLGQALHNRPELIPRVVKFFKEKNLFIPRILFTNPNGSARSALINQATNKYFINISQQGIDFSLARTAKLYHGIYTHDCDPVISPNFENFYVRTLLAHPHVDWRTKDWFYLRTAYSNKSSSGTRNRTIGNRWDNLTTTKAREIFVYQAPRNVNEVFHTFQPTESEDISKNKGLPIAQELTLLEAERLILGGDQSATTRQLNLMLNYAYKIFPASRIKKLEAALRQSAVRLYQDLIGNTNVEQLIDGYVIHKSLNLKLSHLSIQDIYQLEKQIYRAISELPSADDRINSLNRLLLDENRQEEINHANLPRKRILSAPCLSRLCALYADSQAEALGQDNTSDSYQESCLKIIDKIISRSSYPKKLVNKLLVSVNAQESLCKETEIRLRNVFANTHLYEEITVEALVADLTRNDQSINQTIAFLTTPLTDTSRKNFVKAISGNRLSIAIKLGVELTNSEDEETLKEMIDEKSQAHLLELASAFHTIFWSMNIEERAFVLDKIAIPAREDQDMAARAQRIDDYYEQAKHNFFGQYLAKDDDQILRIMEEVSDAYFLALKQLGAEKTEKARLLVSALMIAKHPEEQASDSMEAASNVISVCFKEIGDKLKQCLDSAGFSFPESKHQASPLSQIATWQLFQARDVKIDYLHGRLGSGGAAVVYDVRIGEQRHALRIQREAMLEKTDNYLEELNLTGLILEKMDNKYQLAREIVATLELALRKEINPLNWERQIANHAAHYQNRVFQAEKSSRVITKAPHVLKISIENQYFLAEKAPGYEFITLGNHGFTPAEIAIMSTGQVAIDAAGQISGEASCVDRHEGQVKAERIGSDYILWQLDPLGFELETPTLETLQSFGKILANSFPKVKIISTNTNRGFFDNLLINLDSEIQSGELSPTAIAELKLRRLGWHARRGFIKLSDSHQLSNHLRERSVHPEIYSQLSSLQKLAFKSA